MNSKKINFENPPVVEVVLDVQFQELKNFSSKDFASVYDIFQEDYSFYKEVAPLQESIDNFGNNQIQFQLGISEMPDLRRQCFTSQDKTQMLQFQPDRFVANWRGQGKNGKPYIRYDNIKENYEKNFQKLQKVTGALELIQAEITYINHIKVDDGLNFDEMFAKVFKSFNLLEFDDLKPEGMRWSDRYLYDKNGVKGRLVVTTEAQTRLPDGEKIIALRLSFKGGLSRDIGIINFFDIGNSIITKMFCDITKSEMHKIWGEK